MENLLNTKEAAQYLGLSEKTLTNSRWSGIGVCIDFVKLGSSVKYRKSELDKYIEAHTHSNTSESKEARNEQG